MKTLLTLFVLLFSSSVVAVEGDVYYCETIKNISVKEKENNNRGFEKFKFKRNNDYLQFGGEGVLESMRLKITNSISSLEYFSGGDEGNSFTYQDGSFYYSSVYGNHISVVIASCEIFE